MADKNIKYRRVKRQLNAAKATIKELIDALNQREADLQKVKDVLGEANMKEIFGD